MAFDDLKAAVAEALAGLPQGASVGVAVSGGGDSVALLHLTVQALGARRVRAAVVDHRLRPEAADEALGVCRLGEALAVPVTILAWEAGPEAAAGSGNLMDGARQARLALLSDWARQHGLAAVLLGHTRDDQAETVLMRLARGSGVDGLSGMAASREALGTLWLRPLLAQGRAELRDYLRAEGLAWVDDPSNADPRYLRVRARKALAELANLGITASGLAATAERMGRAREALDAETQRAATAYCREERGVVWLAPTALKLPAEIRDRLLADLLIGLTGRAYRPRHADLLRLIESLTAGQAATLAGLQFLPRDGGDILIAREYAAVAWLKAAVGAVWDGRWEAVPPEGADSAQAQIAPLGEAGLLQLSRQSRTGLHPHWRETGLPATVLQAQPAIWREGRLIAAPLADWPENWALTARPLASLATSRAESD